jgi:hypothetical protein
VKLVGAAPQRSTAGSADLAAPVRVFPVALFRDHLSNYIGFPVIARAPMLRLRRSAP